MSAEIADPTTRELLARVRVIAKTLGANRADDLFAICTTVELQAADLAESVRMATEELRGELDRTQGTCDQLMHELNAICAERDRLRRALELANGLDPYAPDLHKMLEVFDAQRKALSAPRTEETK